MVIAGEAVPMKPGKRAYQVGAWTQRRGLASRSIPRGAQTANWDCNRDGCIPLGAARPAVAGWWTRRKPNAEKLDALCDRVDILVMRAEVHTAKQLPRRDHPASGGFRQGRVGRGVRHALRVGASPGRSRCGDAGRGASAWAVKASGPANSWPGR